MSGFGFIQAFTNAFSPGNDRFDVKLACYSVSFLGKEDLEKGNKIVLPSSALDQLARLNITWPMLFSISNRAQGRSTHGGVMEFSAEEGSCFLPYWMMQNLLLKEGDIACITNTSLPKGSYVKLQPVTKDFLDVSNPRVVLEASLRHFATLTVGDNIVIQYNNKQFEIEIVECKPQNAVSIIETDVEVDFAPPKDWLEPEPQRVPVEPVFPSGGAASSSAAPSPPPEAPGALFSGSGQRVDGKTIKSNRTSSSAAASAAPSAARHTGEFKVQMDEEDEEEPWTKKLPRGLRTACQEFEEMVREGRVPGMAGKLKAGQSSIAVAHEQRTLFYGDGHSLT